MQRARVTLRGVPEDQDVVARVARIAIIVGALSFAGIIVMLVKVAAPAEREERTAPALNTLRSVLHPATRSRWETSLEEGRRASLQELARKVHLSSVQVEFLHAVLGTEQEMAHEVFRRVREDGLPMADARAQVEVIRLGTDKEVDAELDDDQFSSFEEMRPVYRIGGPPPGRR